MDPQELQNMSLGDLLEEDQNDPEVQYAIGLCYHNGTGGTPKNEEKAKFWFQKAAKQGHEPAKKQLSPETREDSEKEPGPGRMKQADMPELRPDTLPMWCAAAAQGEPWAQYRVGVYFLHPPQEDALCAYDPEATQRDGSDCLEKAEKAARDGAAALELAKWYWESDPKKAYTYLINAKDVGNQEAITLLIKCYETGYGVNEDADKAYELREKLWTILDEEAKEKKDPAKWERLAVRCLLGDGVDQNPIRATACASQAEKSECGGQGVVARVEELEKLTTQAQPGDPKVEPDPEARYKLGCWYAEGWIVPRDPAEAFRWYEKAAALDHAEARYAVGICYEEGQGVGSDMVQAAKAYYKAAKLGHEGAKKRLLKALECLGDETVKKEFTPRELGRLGLDLSDAKDYNQAVKWLSMATEQGDAEAEKRLGEHHRDGLGMARDLVKALEYLSDDEMAENCTGQDCFALGQHFEREQSYDRAEDWYSKAAEKDCEKGETALEELRQKRERIRQEEAAAEEARKKEIEARLKAEREARERREAQRREAEERARREAEERSRRAAEERSLREILEAGERALREKARKKKARKDMLKTILTNVIGVVLFLVFIGAWVLIWLAGEQVPVLGPLLADDKIATLLTVLVTLGLAAIFGGIRDL